MLQVSLGTSGDYVFRRVLISCLYLLVCAKLVGLLSFMFVWMIQAFLSLGPGSVCSLAGSAAPGSNMTPGVHYFIRTNKMDARFKIKVSTGLFPIRGSKRESVPCFSPNSWWFLAVFDTHWLVAISLQSVSTFTRHSPMPLFPLFAHKDTSHQSPP